MTISERKIDREYVTGVIVLACIFVLFLSALGVKFLSVKITNIELVDGGLYTVITDNGPVNVSKDDVLRIERTYPKAAITGTLIERNRIYTTKGFIMVSSSELGFFENGKQLINSLDTKGEEIWIKTNKSEATETEQGWNQLLMDNQKIIQPYNYAIGTSPKLIPVVFFVLAVQYLALAVGVVALVVLVFPLRFSASAAKPLAQEEKEHRTSEEGKEIAEMMEVMDVIENTEGSESVEAAVAK